MRPMTRVTRKEQTMSKGLLRISLLAGALVLGCAEGTAPVAELPQEPENALHFLSWDPANGPVDFAAFGATPYGPIDFVDQPLRAVGDSVLVDSYAVSFWAVRGEQRFIQINYIDSLGAVESPYVRFDVSDPVQRPNGSGIAVGDSVLITVSVDPTDIVVRFEPSGLQFGNASELQMWYGGASDDLNGDGSVDSTDADIQQNQLGMWWQEQPIDPWDSIIADHSIELEWFRAWLEHFSGYAVSW